MRRKPPKRFLRPALLVAAALGAAPAPVQSAPPVSIAASDKPKDAVWAAMPIEELRHRANTNETPAMEELGRRLLSGITVPRDASTGATWYRLAAEAGSPTAAFTMGVLYERGISVERDSARAVEWYRKAADGNVAVARHNLALMLRDGRGVAQDGPKAVELLRAAARQGMTASMFTLGDMYERGGAVLKDPAAALAWFSIANEFELQASSGTITPLAESARSRGEALERVISGVDRERAEKIGQEEFRQIVTALMPQKPPARPPMASSASPSSPASMPSAASPPSPTSAAPSATAEKPEPAWPKATVDQVKAVQQVLIDLHRLRGKADGAAGPATRSAIRDFEKSAGLPETGQVSRELYLALVKAKARHDDTAIAPAPAPDAATWPARSADQIRAIQELLVELKLLNAEPTGTVGPLTRRAIRDYQRKSGLKETGEPSRALFESLKAARAKAGG